MKKTAFVSFFIFFALTTYSQGLDCLSEFKYEMVKFDDGILRTKNGQFTVCLWDDQFSFLLPNGGGTSFTADRIDKEIDKNGITVISFINKENETTAFGTYLVTIRYGKIKEVEIQNTMSGVFYRVKSRHFIGQPDAYGVTVIKQADTSIKTPIYHTPPKVIPDVGFLETDSINNALNPYLHLDGIAPTVSIRDFIQTHTEWRKNRYGPNSRFMITISFNLDPDYSIKDVKITGLPYDMQNMNKVIAEELQSANIGFVDRRKEKTLTKIRFSIDVSS